MHREYTSRTPVGTRAEVFFPPESYNISLARPHTAVEASKSCILDGTLDGTLDAASMAPCRGSVQDLQVKEAQWVRPIGPSNMQQANYKWTKKTTAITYRKASCTRPVSFPVPAMNATPPLCTECACDGQRPTPKEGARVRRTRNIVIPYSKQSLSTFVLCILPPTIPSMQVACDGGLVLV